MLRIPSRSYARSCYKTKPRKWRDVNKVKPIKKKIASDVRSVFSQETVAVVHFSDMNTPAWTQLRHKLAVGGAKAQVIPTKIATRALDDTPLKNIVTLFNGSTALVYGDMECTSSLLECIKSEPKLFLLGGKVMDQLFTPSGLEKVAKLPPIESLRMELVSLLSLPQRETLSLLQSPSISLSHSLSIHTSSDSSEQQDTQ